MITKSRTDLAGLTCRADFSDDAMYRYYLEWRWSEERLLPVCMLNPSTATHEMLDPTIRGLVTRAKNWKYGGVAVVNLFAFRSPSPAVMRRAKDPVGPENDKILLKLAHSTRRDTTVVVAWGKNGSFNGRDAEVLEMFDGPLSVFGLNIDGTPKHPLYVKLTTPLSLWSPSSSHEKSEVGFLK